MNSNVKLVLTAIFALAAGFLIARTLKADTGLDIAYDFEDCIEKCYDLPQLDELIQTRDACIESLDLPDLEVCFHVPVENRIECVRRIMDEYKKRTKPCNDAFDTGVRNLENCNKECRLLLDIPIKEK
ncbi:MAG: hypothetical protein KDC49_08260 [Saprospiraceae bacterium]|nr:hypothetical protein [Saprospiraceae bacterium]